MGLSRRDFLLFRREREERVIELSCQRLYMRCLDAQMTAVEPTEDGDAPNPWGHEPAAVHAKRTVEQILQEIALSLNDADVLKLVDREWIRDPVVNAGLDALVAAFTSRGGRVVTPSA